MTTLFDQHTGILMFHLSTLSSYSPSLQFPIIHTGVGWQGNHVDQSQFPDWRRQVEEFRNRFDLDNDLSGHALAKTWGLDTHCGWITACFTLHPTDMVEYLTSSREHLTIIFSPPNQSGESGVDVRVPWPLPSVTDDAVRHARMEILKFILDPDQRVYTGSPWQKKLLYAAACCTITEYAKQAELLALSKPTLEWLSARIGVDLSVEVSYIIGAESQLSNASGNEIHGTIPAKTAEQLQGVGGEVFEVCEICGGGIEWYSANESQCSSGHVFGL
jgi:hypothetical protein